MSRRNNQNNNYNGNQYYGNGQYYGGNNRNYNNGQYGQYNQNGQYGQYNQQYSQNSQYYKQGHKFGLYDQPQQNNNGKKSIDKNLLIKIGLFAGFAIILLLIVFAINSCGKKEKAHCADDYKEVGSQALGYVCIPTDWVNFKDTNSNRGLRYSDVSGTYIITIDGLPTSEINAQNYALGVANNLEKLGVKVQGAESKIGDYNAYQVYGYSEESGKTTWILTYFFEANDGYTHYLGVEGPSKDNEAFKIPESFKEAEKK